MNHWCVVHRKTPRIRACRHRPSHVRNAHTHPCARDAHTPLCARRTHTIARTTHTHPRTLFNFHNNATVSGFSEHDPLLLVSFYKIFSFCIINCMCSSAHTDPLASPAPLRARAAHAAHALSASRAPGQLARLGGHARLSDLPLRRICHKASATQVLHAGMHAHPPLLADSLHASKFGSITTSSMSRTSRTSVTSRPMQPHEMPSSSMGVTMPCFQEQYLSP